MTTHRPILSTGEIYHVYNRTIGKENVFNSIKNLYKTFSIIDYYRYHQIIRLSKFILLPTNLKQAYLLVNKTTPLIDIFSFSFMPNHFHFLIKQLKDKGISLFISNFQNSFAKYFNLKYNRTGGLFQSSFKAKRINTNEEFIHISRYIHLNHVTASIIDFEELYTYPWTSYPCYLNTSNIRFVNINPILNHFRSSTKYDIFVKNQVNYQKKLRIIKELLID